MAARNQQVRRLASAQDLERLQAAMHVLNLAVISLAQDLESLSDDLVEAGILGGPEPDEDEGPSLLAEEAFKAWEEYEVSDHYPEDFVPDVAENDPALAQWADDGGPAGPDPEEIAAKRRERIEQRRAAAEAANASTEEEIAASDFDFNSVGNIPEDGIEVTVPGRERRGEGDIDPRL